ncbi:hypothetical protein Tco_0675483 [Tanacetum coccineum]
MAIPEDYLEKFYKMTDAKDMWEAIKSIFSGNDESNKMQKYILKQQFESFSISNSEGLHKGYDRFQSLLSQLEIRGAGSARYSSSTQNVAFISLDSIASTNDVVRLLYGVSTSSGYNSQRENSSSYTDELINGFEMASGHDFNEIEEVLQEDKKKAVVILLESADQKGMKISGGEMQGTLGGDLENRRNIKLWFMKIDLDDKTDLLTYHKKLLAEAVKEKEELKTKLEYFQSSSKGLSKLLKSQMSAKDKYGLGYGDQIHKGVLSYENEVFQSVFDIVETLESVPEPVVVEPKVVSQPKVWSDAPIIEEYESDKTPRETVKEQNTCSLSPKADKRDWNGLMSKRLGLGYGFTKKAHFVCGSFSHLIRDCDFHEKRMAKQVELNKKKDDPQKALKNKGIIDSGCSRHMTRNKAYLVEYQDYNGGLVAFRGSNGQITGKDEVVVQFVVALVEERFICWMDNSS